MITIQTECADRKEMVRKLSDFLSIPAVYMRTPTYAFQIGNITVNRDASITGPRTELAPVARFLMENGYINGWPADMFEEPAAVEPAEDLKADAADEDLKAPSPEPIDRICVSIPLGNCTPQGLCNIIRMVYARQALITAMTRSDLISIDEEVVSLLDDSKPETIDQISELLKSETAVGMLHGITVEDGTALRRRHASVTRSTPRLWITPPPGRRRPFGSTICRPHLPWQGTMAGCPIAAAEAPWRIRP